MTYYHPTGADQSFVFLLHLHIKHVRVIERASFYREFHAESESVVKITGTYFIRDKFLSL